MYISSYEESLRAAFDKAAEECLTNDRAALIKKIVDEINQAVVDQIYDYARDELLSNLKDSICAEAAAVAESMLMNALAGDDKAIRELFGFQGFYMNNAYAGRMPTQWALIGAIVDRRPHIFADERLKQREREIEIQAAEIDRLRKAYDRLREYYGSVAE